METAGNIIIFGATGRVGSCVSRILAKKGFNLGLHYFSNEKKALALKDELSSLAPEGTFVPLRADTRDINETRDLIAKASDAFSGEIDGVVNFIHGDNYTPKEVEHMVWEDWDIHLDALKSYFNISNAVIPVMKARSFGRIIFISGGLAFRFFKGTSAYSTVKAGLNAFSKSMAVELGRDNITVNIVAPGKVVGLEDEKGQSFSEDNASNSPTGRFSTPEDIAAGIEFFMGRNAGNITGQTLYVSGGEIMPMP